MLPITQSEEPGLAADCQNTNYSIGQSISTSQKERL